jgi:hypothetical protein
MASRRGVGWQAFGQCECLCVAGESCGDVPLDDLVRRPPDEIERR